jgi:lipoprotein-anchoring transpeptidase ErfK/SrfK
VVLPAGVAGAVAEGKSKIDAGDLVAGRAVLNEALMSGSLSAADAAAAKRLMSEANRQIVFSPRRFAADPFQGTHTVQSGEVLQKIAYGEGVTWEYLCRINGLADPRRMRAGATLKTVRGPFHAVVTKGTFAMDVYLGSPGKAGAMYVTTLPVGLGANDSTPTGTWVAGGKLKNPAYFSPRGEGIIAADDPKNPLGEFWISLQGVEGQAVGKVSYGIHGTIEPESIGTQSSLGCIRLRAEDIALVYELLVEGKSMVVVRE